MWHILEGRVELCRRIPHGVALAKTHRRLTSSSAWLLVLQDLLHSYPGVSTLPRARF